MADEDRDRKPAGGTSGTNQEMGDMIDASRATQGASAPPGDGSETRGQQGEGMQDVPEVTGDEGGGEGGGATGGARGAQDAGGTRETGRVGQGDMQERGGEGGYGGSSGFEGGAKGARDS